ncbi:conserved hypothetical protein [Luminiphilus syltensis NOR5-1B]|uniref:Tll0287-like domain-containing protein n=1 Tax=Luminiphilus syltensis NOR5-1B TaxID=565045 RepID=B8KTV4_9GAMM|nr:DUF3365 domain-containing protein [Luminiphilus syltensis]EED35925.1 conserved hypothetical protein [Luminiphilus syltensis NOR5-1B]
MRITVNTVFMGLIVLTGGWLMPAVSSSAGQTGATIAHDSVSEKPYLQRGKAIAADTGNALGAKLIEALGVGGPTHAIDFCNLNAESITQSIAEKHRVGVRRVSDKPRNPNNAASESELDYINASKALLAKGEAPAPWILEQPHSITGYYPIVAGAMCLQCHGTPGKDVSAATAALLNQLYPEDQALGYSAGDLRGVFVITMPNAE